MIYVIRRACNYREIIVRSVPIITIKNVNVLTRVLDEQKNLFLIHARVRQIALILQKSNMEDLPLVKTNLSPHGERTRLTEIRSYISVLHGNPGFAPVVALVLPPSKLCYCI